MSTSYPPLSNTHTYVNNQIFINYLIISKPPPFTYYVHITSNVYVTINFIHQSNVVNNIDEVMNPFILSFFDETVFYGNNNVNKKSNVSGNINKNIASSDSVEMARKLENFSSSQNSGSGLSVIKRDKFDNEVGNSEEIILGDDVSNKSDGLLSSNEKDAVLIENEGVDDDFYHGEIGIFNIFK